MSTTSTCHVDRPLCVRRVDATQAADALEVWRSVERAMGTTAYASSSWWTEAWLRHYGAIVPHEFLIAEAGGRPRGCCLLTCGTNEKLGPFQLRSRHLGTAGESDAESVCVEYNHLLIEERFRADFCRSIVDHAANDPDWDQFQLDGFTPDDANALLNALPSVTFRRRPSPYFDLRRTREQGVDILANLGGSTRSNLRRRLRDYGELTVQWVETLTQAEDVFSELVSLHQARWNAVGKPGAFASRRFHDFQLELLTSGLLDRRVVLFRVRQGQQTIGCLFLLVDRNRLLDYLSGFAAFEQFASPGLVVHYLCMEEALRRGYDAYDFLVGEHQHKRNLSNAENQLLWATWRRDRLKFRVADAARALKRSIAAGRLRNRP